MKDTSITTLNKQEIGAPKCYSNRDSWGSFKVNPELWSRFKTECKLRGVSICHVLEALMEAWIEGQRATATVIKPVVVNLTMQHIVERPRRKGHIEICNPNPYLCEQKCAEALRKQLRGGET